MRTLVVLTLFCANVCLHSQTSVEFKPTWNGRTIDSTSSLLQLSGGVQIQLDKLKFYVSAFQFLGSDGSNWKEDSSFHLIDFELPTTLKFNVALPITIEPNTIIFCVGVDSATNVSGVMGGALDPTKGMYWTWQSGYINVKIEGMCIGLTANNKGFEFHLGGYRSPFLSVQTLALPLAANNSSKIVVEIALERFFGSIDIRRVSAVMSPGAESVEISQQFAKCFQLSNP